eukprot:12824791-Alexandrium_andersonii.AAC.1
MGRRLEGRVVELADSPWKNCKNCKGWWVPAVPSKSAAAAARACMGTHLVADGKLYPLGQAR